MAISTGVQISKGNEEPWREAPTSTGATREMTEGISRRMRARGAQGMFVQDVRYRPGKVVKPHSHTRAQIFYILDGDATFDNGVHFQADDAVEVPARAVYGFTAGDKGCRLLIIRTGEAKMIHPTNGDEAEGDGGE
jgi:mannose-6-phosphate isomerase-like protein (cupin superfamily)